MTHEDTSLVDRQQTAEAYIKDRQPVKRSTVFWAILWLTAVFVAGEVARRKQRTAILKQEIQRRQTLTQQPCPYCGNKQPTANQKNSNVSN